jgi:hypothetical protein
VYDHGDDLERGDEVRPLGPLLHHLGQPASPAMTTPADSTLTCAPAEVTVTRVPAEGTVTCALME